MEESASQITNQFLLQVKNLTKTFPGVKALSSVDLDIRRGAVHALLGENGAGKSTLVKILSGGYLPDSGSMTLDGAAYAPSSPHDAISAGVRVVHQELNLLPYLSAAENIFLEKLPRKGPFLDYQKLYSDSQALLARVGLDIDPAASVELLGVAQRQLIEIARAISASCKLLILDEPTASLSSRDAKRLFEIIRALQAQGITAIYISHHLNEIYEIAGDLSILRNGEMVTTRKVAGTGIPQIVSAMVGRRMESEYPFREFPAEHSRGPMMEVRNLRFKGNKYPVSFSLNRGEILGISGLVGSKRTETVRAIFGADPKESGEIFIEGEKTDIRSPADAVAAGLSLLTEDRKEQGLVLDMPLASNVTLAALEKVSRAGIIGAEAEYGPVRKLSGDLNIKTPSILQMVRNLSGGNQQKAVLAKWLFKDARVLIFDEPTRGIDVGAKYEIYLLLWKLLEEGKGILIVSSDLNELMGICHRILVFSDGEIKADLKRGREPQKFDQERILSCAYENYLN